MISRSLMLPLRVPSTAPSAATTTMTAKIEQQQLGVAPGRDLFGGLDAHDVRQVTPGCRVAGARRVTVGVGDGELDGEVDDVSDAPVLAPADAPAAGVVEGAPDSESDGVAVTVGVRVGVGVAVGVDPGAGQTGSCWLRSRPTIAVASRWLSAVMPARSWVRAAGVRSATRRSVCCSTLKNFSGPNWVSTPRKIATSSPSAPTKYCCWVQA